MPKVPKYQSTGNSPLRQSRIPWTSHFRLPSGPAQRWHRQSPLRFLYSPVMAASLKIPVSIPRAFRFQRSSGRRLLPALLIIAALAFPLWHLQEMNRDFHLPPTHNDLISRWAGTRAALQGQDPYSPEVTQQIEAVADHDSTEAFAYPAYFVVLLAPFASLSWKTFSVTYLIVVIPALLLGLWLSTRLLHLPITREKSALVAVLALSSWPVFWALRMQQPTLLASALILIACFLLSRNHGLSAGFLLALATFKPQLALPIVLWLAFWACIDRRWTFLASFAVTMALLLSAAEIIVPGWFPHWLASAHAYQNRFGDLPLQSLLGRPLSVAVVLALAAWSGWRLWQMRNCPAFSPQFGLAAALVFSVTVCTNFTQPMMIYNQILLIPGCMLLVLTPRPAGNGLPIIVYRTAQFFVAWAFISVPVGIVAEALWKHPTVCDLLPFRNPLLPFLIALFLLLTATRAARSLPTASV